MCEDVAGGSQHSGGESFFFARTHFLACEDVAGGSQQSGGNVFFAKYGGPSDGSPLSGGGIIILRVIRRHPGGTFFFAKYGGPSSGSQQSGGMFFFAK